MVELRTRTTPQFFDHLWPGVGDGFLILDEHGRVVAANEAAALTLGYKQEELIGCAYRAFWPKELPSPFELSLDRDDGRSRGVNICRQDGQFMAANLSIHPLTTAGDDYLLIVLDELSQIEHINEALAHMQRLAGMGMLMAGVAHDLVTPISIITNTCSNLLIELEEETLHKEDLRRYIQMIEQSVWRCTRIVDVMRNYTFNDAQSMAVTDLAAIVDDGLTLLRHQFRGEFKVEAEVDLDPTLKSVVCDHNQMTQVLVNLLINARDAMQPNGGTIQIKAWPLPLGERAAFVDGRTAVEEYAIMVRDSGHGIDPAIMDKIFNPFFTTKPEGQGTGLGLFLARQIVRQHNGRIWAENNPTGGAAFTVILPRKR